MSDAQAEINERFGKLTTEELKALIAAIGTGVVEAIDFAFDCAEIENWETMQETVTEVEAEWEKLLRMLALYTVKMMMQAEAADGAE